jgi:outer membrane protein assembly factor BamE (lipoprotein component of BamABCDE complex)
MFMIGIARSCILCTVLAVTAGCAPRLHVSGNMASPDAVRHLSPGKQDKRQVLELLGTPSSHSTFDPNIWFYIGQKTEQIAFFRPEITEHRVLAVSFDAQDRLDSVTMIGRDQYRDIKPVRKATPTAGKKLTIIEQMVGNFGRFNREEGSGAGRPVGRQR